MHVASIPVATVQREFPSVREVHSGNVATRRCEALRIIRRRVVPPDCGTVGRQARSYRCFSTRWKFSRPTRLPAGSIRGVFFQKGPALSAPVSLQPPAPVNSVLTKAPLQFIHPGNVLDVVVSFKSANFSVPAVRSLLATFHAIVAHECALRGACENRHLSAREARLVSTLDTVGSVNVPVACRWIFERDSTVPLP